MRQVRDESRSDDRNPESPGDKRAWQDRVRAVGDFLPASFAISIATSIVVSARVLPDERGQLASAEPSRTRRKVLHSHLARISYSG
jgi:hypothetical protein